MLAIGEKTRVRGSAGNRYEIRRVEKHTSPSGFMCSCLAWRFNPERMCKHIQRFRSGVETASMKGVADEMRDAVGKSGRAFRVQESFAVDYMKEHEIDRKQFPAKDGDFVGVVIGKREFIFYRWMNDGRWYLLKAGREMYGYDSAESAFKYGRR